MRLLYKVFLLEPRNLRVQNPDIQQRTEEADGPSPHPSPPPSAMALFTLRLATASLLLSCAHAFSAPGLAMPRLGRGAAVCSVPSRVGLAGMAPAPARSLRRSGAASVGMGLVDRELITEGDGKTFPQAGDTLTGPVPDPW